MVTLAHGLIGTPELPIPVAVFFWVATGVLVVSFLALGVAWREPRLAAAGTRGRALGAGASRVLAGRAAEGLAGAFGVSCLVLVVVAGLAGTDGASNNLAPTFVYTAFWLWPVVLSVLLGDVFRALNPWRAVGRVVGAVVQRCSDVPPLPYPERLGCWPAALGLFAFGVVELVDTNGDDPQHLATLALAYSALTWLGMAVFGVEAWSRNGEAFGVWFSLLARLAPLRRDDGGRLRLRAPLTGLADLSFGPGGTAVVLVSMGVVTFDGLSGGQLFIDLSSDAVDALRPAEGGGTEPILVAVYLAGLLVSITGIAVAYGLAVSRMPRPPQGGGIQTRAATFAPSLVPIAVAYVAAHYVGFWLYGTVDLVRLVSDPLGRGWDLFGTASNVNGLGLLSPEVFWALQVVVVVAGHVAGLALAHDRALTLYGSARAAARSQWVMLAVMVALTVLALWLLSSYDN